jgi:hypothetical protein
VVYFSLAILDIVLHSISRKSICNLLPIPAGTVHDFEAIGTENLLVFVAFAPPLGEKDRHLV